MRSASDGLLHLGRHGAQLDGIALVLQGLLVGMGTSHRRLGRGTRGQEVLGQELLYRLVLGSALGVAFVHHVAGMGEDLLDDGVLLAKLDPQDVNLGVLLVQAGLKAVGQLNELLVLSIDATELLTEAVGLTHLLKEQLQEIVALKLLQLLVLEPLRILCRGGGGGGWFACIVLVLTREHKPALSPEPCRGGKT